MTRNHAHPDTPHLEPSLRRIVRRTHGHGEGFITQLMSPSGIEAQVATRMPAALICAIESWAAQNGISRSEAIRRLVKGLDVTPVERRGKP